MSIVGPRPERPELAAELEKSVEHYDERVNVPPGLTGWAQVQYPYTDNAEDAATKLEYDLYSLRHHGPGMYVMVLFRTLGALVLRPGR